MRTHIYVFMLAICFVCFSGVIMANDAPTSISIAPDLYLHENKITPHDISHGDEFGKSVAISGDYAIVGSPFNNSAYIYKRLNNRWIEQTRLRASEGVSSNRFGFSVAIFGDYAMVGAPYDEDNAENSGAAYVFKRDGKTWNEEAKLIAADGEEDAFLGVSISISNDYAVAGAYRDDAVAFDSGAAYIFKRNGSDWSDQTKLIPSDAYAQDRFGFVVSISGDYLLVTASNDNDMGINSGSAYIFKHDGANWIREDKITAFDGTAYREFGSSACLYEDYAIIGSRIDNGGGDWSGHAYIYKQIGTDWIEQTKLGAADGTIFDFFGFSVAISNDYAAVGAFRDNDKGFESGSAYFYKEDGGAWPQQTKLTASDGDKDNHFAISTSISGDYIIFGSNGDSENGTDSGSAYLYYLNIGVEENSPYGTQIGSIAGVDPDDDPLTYILQSDPSGNFEVVNDSGTWKLQVASAADLDYEVAQTHDITIRADDGSGGIYDQDFTVNVFDVNDSLIEIYLSSNTIEENSPIGTQVGIITGVDPESDPLTFSLLNHLDNFEVVNDGGTWKLQTAAGAALDYEDRQSIDIILSADDGTGDLRYEDFTINVLDVNEAPVVLASFRLIPTTELDDMLKAYFTMYRFRDPEDDTMVAIEWKLGDTVIATTPDFYYNFADRGPHEVTVRAQDEHGLWSEPVLFVVDWLEGDVNGDDIVNLADFEIFRNVFGTDFPAADFDKSGAVNLADFVILRNHFGESR